MKVEVELAESTAEELKEYARWVELSSSLTTDDAACTTVDYALRELFKRDRLWQDRRRKGAEPPAPVSAKGPPQVSPPTCLPPPSPSSRPVPTPASATGTR
jgi:hypothetical protein